MKYSKQYKMGEFVSNGKEKYYNFQDFYNYIKDSNIKDYKFIKKQGKGKRSTKEYEVLNMPVSFDIETSSVKFKDNAGHEHKASFTYAIGMSINGHVGIMRTWEEFKTILSLLQAKLGLSYESRRMIIYVHNLSYEYQFMRKHFRWIDVFAMKARKILYCRNDMGFEFRCSYLLSSMNLDNVGKNLKKYRCAKMVGDLDYSLIRFPETEMTEKEIGYLVNDVRVVTNYIKEKMEEDGDILHIQYTKTGYVRKHCKEACIDNNPNKEKYMSLMKELTMTEEEMLYAMNAYSGGFTNACDVNVNRTFIKARGFDFTSSYPAVMVSNLYPMSRGTEVYFKNEKEFIKVLGKKAVLGKIRITNLRVKDGIHGHPISVSKCTHQENVEEANGRVVSADVVEIFITDVDYMNFIRFYNYDKIEFIEKAFVYDYNYLPRELIMCVLDFYKGKTELKGVKGQEILYAAMKELLNSIYGEMVMNVCRDVIIAPELSESEDWEKEKPDFMKSMSLYNTSKNRYKSYLWGVWITAWARYNVMSGVLECCKEDENGVVDYIYTDTDSIKLQNYDRHEKFFKDYNEQQIEKLKMSAKINNIDIDYYMPKSKNGKVKALGVWDDEGELTIRALGAKRYIARHDGITEITVAGVSKRIGSEALCNKYGAIECFDKFTDGLVFDEDMCGKQKVYYCDHEESVEMCDYTGKLCVATELSSVYMEPGTYDMSLSTKFKNYLLKIWEMEE